MFYLLINQPTNHQPTQPTNHPSTQPTTKDDSTQGALLNLEYTKVLKKETHKDRAVS